MRPSRSTPARLLSKSAALGQRLIIPSLVILAVAFGVYLSLINGTGLFGSRQTVDTVTISGGTRTEQSLPGKTLWDWLTVAGVPLVLGALGFVLNESVRKSSESATQRKEATDRELAVEIARDGALRDFLDQMSQLILTANLTAPVPPAAASKIARSRVLLTLQQLEAGAEWAPSEAAKTNNRIRKGAVLRFLHETGLVEAAQSAVGLSGANFEGTLLPKGTRLVRANLAGAQFARAQLEIVDLTGTIATGADWSKSSLQGAVFRDGQLAQSNFTGANLKEAVFAGANLAGAVFEGASLRRADFRGANLRAAKLLRVESLRDTLLQGADLSQAEIAQVDLAMAHVDPQTTMPDGSKWTP